MGVAEKMPRMRSRYSRKKVYFSLLDKSANWIWDLPSEFRRRILLRFVGNREWNMICGVWDMPNSVSICVFPKLLIIQEIDLTEK